MRRLLLVLLLLVLGAPVSADAATVGARVFTPDPGEPGGPQSPFRSTVYTAAPGEANDLIMTSTATGLVFHDSVPLTVEGGCTQVDVTTATCPRPTTSTSIDLGDGDDAFGPGVELRDEVFVRGGAGADRLTGGTAGDGLHGDEGDDALIGGAGDDRLAGDTGADRSEGGDGNDRFIGAAGADPGQDGYDGGPGFDLIDFSAETVPVTIALGDGVTRPGGRDGLAGVESAIGGSGDDTLVGTPGPDRLDGGDGADELEAMDGADVVIGGAGGDRLFADGGDDRIEDGPGTDAVDAGTGNDLLEVAPDWSDKGADTFACGAGLDVLTGLGRRDTAGPACERQRVGTAPGQVDVVRATKRSGRRFTVTVVCVPAPGAGRCRLYLRPSLNLDRTGKPGRVLVRANGSLRGHSGAVRLRFTFKPAALRRMRRAGRRVRLVLDSSLSSPEDVPLRLPG